MSIDLVHFTSSGDIDWQTSVKKECSLTWGTVHDNDMRVLPSGEIEVVYPCEIAAAGMSPKQEVYSAFRFDAHGTKLSETELLRAPMDRSSLVNLNGSVLVAHILDKGDIALGGTYDDDSWLPGTKGTFGGQRDGFVVVFDASGRHLSTRTFNGPLARDVYTVERFRSGQLVVGYMEYDPKKTGDALADAEIIFEKLEP